MDLIYYKLIAGILILATSLVAIIYPIRVRAHPAHHAILEGMDAFASGVFLGAALFHMLPDAVSGFGQLLGSGNHYPIAELFCAAGFLVLLFFERLAQSKSCATSAMPYMVALMLIIHSFIEGGALGINVTLETAFVIFVAIIIHKGSESFALAVILNRSGLTLKKMILLAGIFSLMTPAGILIGTSMSSMLSASVNQWCIAGFNAFAAGTFLYMSTLHHINHHEREHGPEGLLEFLFLLSGLAVMAVIAYWV